MKFVYTAAAVVIGLFATGGVVEAVPRNFQDPCWRVCWQFIPTCPAGWYSNNLGTAADPCWTCCKAPGFGKQDSFVEEFNGCT